MNNESKSLVQLEGTAIQEIVKQAINAAVIANLGDPAQMVRHVVEKAMAQKVDPSGNINSSSYYNDRSLVEAVATINIQNATRAVVKEFFDTHHEEIRKAVISELRKKKTVHTIASKFIENLVQQAGSSGLKIEMSVTK